MTTEEKITKLVDGVNTSIQATVKQLGSTGALAVSLTDGSGSPTGGMQLNNYDYVSLTLTNSTTETYTFKSGGSGGTTTNTIVIVYTDSTKSTISTVTKT